MINVDEAPRTAVRIKEVAHCARVSAATVSRVVNNRGKYSAETRERVLGVIQELGYLADGSPRPVARRRKTRTIGLLVPHCDTEFMLSSVGAVTNAASAAGYQTLLGVKPEGVGARLLSRQNADGVLVFPNCLAESDLKILVAEQCPLVLMYHVPPGGLAVPRITIDNMASTHRVVSHLIEAHGRRRVVHLRGKYGNSDGVLRESAYRQALLEHDIQVDPRLIRAGGDAAAAFASTLELLQEGVAFDAIFAWSDDSAAGAISALRAAGKSVPEDVSVVGFDDAAMAKHLDSPLTTVRAPTDAVARHAVQQLLNLIDGGAAVSKPPLATEVIYRRSCGCTG